MNARTLPFYFSITVIAIGACGILVPRMACAQDTKRATLEARAAGSDPKIAAVALYELAEIDDHDFEFASALARYDASIARDPSHRYALRAHAHADTLRAHSEGDFAPYTELEKLRRDRVLSRDPAALAVLAKDADQFPPGLVRSEARMLAGDALMAQGDFEHGIPLLELVDTDPKSDPILQHQAAHELVDAYLARGNPQGALAIASRPKEDPALLKKVRTSMRRTKMRTAAFAVLALFGLASAIAIGRNLARGHAADVASTLRRFAPLGIAFAAWTGVCGGLLAASYERGNESPFLVLALGAAPIFLIARAWSASGGASRAARIGRALLSAASVAAVAFVVLTWVGDGVYLAGFGL